MDPAVPESAKTAQPGQTLIGRGCTYATITDKISALVLTQPAPCGW